MAQRQSRSLSAFVAGKFSRSSWPGCLAICLLIKLSHFFSDVAYGKTWHLWWQWLAFPWQPVFAIEAVFAASGLASFHEYACVLTHSPVKGIHAIAAVFINDSF
jgi:hypothetical protein